jgi:hypothetical protein
VNASLDTNIWSQISLEGTNDITAVQFRHPQGKTTLFNIYNDCTHSNTLHALDSFVKKERRNLIQTDSDIMFWCGDFNRHHPMWDEERNHHLFTAGATKDTEELYPCLQITT